MLANLSVTTEKLAGFSVTSAKIAPDAVTSDKIANGTILEEDIADQQISTRVLQDGSVTTAKLADEAVTNAKIATGAVNSRTIEDGSVRIRDLNPAVFNRIDRKDARTLRQANSYTDQQVGFLRDEVTAGLAETRRRADAGTAAALAAAPFTLEPGKQLGVAINMGQYGAQTAIGLNAGWRIDDVITANIGASHAVNNGKLAFRMGVAFQF